MAKTENSNWHYWIGVLQEFERWSEEVDLPIDRELTEILFALEDFGKEAEKPEVEFVEGQPYGAPSNTEDTGETLSIEEIHAKYLAEKQDRATQALKKRLGELETRKSSGARTKTRVKEHAPEQPPQKAKAANQKPKKKKKKKKQKPYIDAMKFRVSGSYGSSKR